MQILVPVLVLATVALSSSNVAPILTPNDLNDEPLSYDYQHKDNIIFGNKDNAKNSLNAILLNIDVEPEKEKSLDAYDMDTDNNDLNGISKNYDEKGFRQDQWHNYPRQLDRLNRYLFEHYSTDKRNLDPDDPEAYRNDKKDEFLNEFDDTTSNQILTENNPEPSKIQNEAEEVAAVINPLLIFRIHLACFKKDQEIRQQQSDENDNDFNAQQKHYENNIVTEGRNPDANANKVKREGKTNTQNVLPQKSSKNRTMRKRIFSLWSRLQSLNQKGHELHHRRHMYALYGLPDSEGGGGGGILTAETRATFMRPPGSPLRWG